MVLQNTDSFLLTLYSVKGILGYMVTPYLIFFQTLYIIFRKYY